MSELDNLENIDETRLNELKLKKMQEELAKSFESYKKKMEYMVCDAPISILCLPSPMEKLLLNNDFLRVYDLFDRDFTKVKGFGKARVRDLTSRLNQFFSMF
jgi:hypothetical protein